MLFSHGNAYVIVAFGNCMVLLNSAEVYMVAMDLWNSVSIETGDTKELMLIREYGKAMENIALLNKATTLPLLCHAKQFVMFSSLQLPGILQNGGTPSTALGLVMLQKVIRMVTYWIAAEGNWKMKQVKKVIISLKFPISQAPNVATAFLNLAGEDGLTGRKIFVVSYDFLGSVMTAIFTFVLVVQQMKIS